MKCRFSGLGLLLVAWGSADGALVNRMSGQAYYDDVLDITWIADANLAGSNTFAVGGINNGVMSWTTANEWVAAMNTTNHLGTSDWRLPLVAPLNGSTFNYFFSFNGSTDFGSNQSEQGTALRGVRAAKWPICFQHA